MSERAPRKGRSAMATSPACMSSPLAANTSRMCSGFDMMTSGGIEAMCNRKVSPYLSRHSSRKGNGRHSHRQR
jgi:hypothetical protein